MEVIINKEKKIITIKLKKIKKTQRKDEFGMNHYYSCPQKLLLRTIFYSPKPKNRKTHLTIKNYFLFYVLKNRKHDVFRQYFFFHLLFELFKKIII